MMRLLALALLLVLAVGGLAFAQDLAVVQQTADTAVLIDRQTVRRAGNTANVRTYAYARPSAGAPQVYVELEEEFDCTALRARRRILRILDPQGRTVSQEAGTFGDWQALTPVNVQVMVAVCQGQGMAAFSSAGTLATFSQRMSPQAPARAATAAPAPAQAPAQQAVWIDNGARAAGANPTLVQLGTRRLNGSVAAVTRLTLLLEPVMIEGQPMRWRETATEFDCVGHRARTADRVYYDLGRTRRAAPQDSSFSQWFDATPGSVLRAQEDLVCRDVRGPNAREITDLDAYQRQVFAGGSAPAATAVGPPSSRAAAPTGLARTGWVEVAIMSQATDRWLMLPSSKQVNGNRVSATTIMLTLQPAPTDGQDNAWTAAVFEFDCATHQFRFNVHSYYNLARTRRTPSPDQSFTGWDATRPGSIQRAHEDFLCRGVRGANTREIADLDAFQRQALGPASAAAPAAAPPARQASTQQAQSAQAATPRPAGAPATWIEIEGMSPAGQVMLHDLASRRANGSVISLRVTTLLIEPLKTEYGDVSWYEGTAELDCASHRYRLRLDTALDRDRSIQIPLRNPQQLDWRAIGSDAAPLDDAVCRNLRTAKVKAQPDLTLMRAGETALFQAQRAVAQMRANGGQQPARAPDPQRFWVWGLRNIDTITVIDLPSRRRLGSYAMVDQLLLSRDALDVRGELYPWREMVVEIDCSTNRVRERNVGIANADRSRHLAMGDDLAKAWSGPATNDHWRDLVAFVCRDARGATIDPVPDLRVFQQRFVAGQPAVAGRPGR